MLEGGQHLGAPELDVLAGPDVRQLAAACLRAEPVSARSSSAAKVATSTTSAVCWAGDSARVSTCSLAASRMPASAGSSAAGHEATAVAICARIVARLTGNPRSGQRILVSFGGSCGPGHDAQISPSSPMFKTAPSTVTVISTSQLQSPVPAQRAAIVVVQVDVGDGQVEPFKQRCRPSVAARRTARDRPPGRSSAG